MARRVSSAVLIGRERETRAFESALAEAVARRPAVLVIGGEAGAGKSRLVSEFAVRTRSSGGSAAIGYSPPASDASGVPLAALTQALRSLVRSIDAREVAAWLGPAHRELAVLLPELGPPPAPDRSADPFGWARLLEAVLIAVERAAERRPPLLLALEDLHWMDASTRAAILHLCRSLVGVPLVLVATYRSDTTGVDGTLPGLLAELDRLPTVERLELTPLTAAQVREQLVGIMGTEPPVEVIEAIVRRADGNPFYVEELVLTAPDREMTGAPLSVRTMVEARLAQLPPRAGDLVHLVAAAEQPIAIELIATAAGVAGAEAVAAIGDALAQHLLTMTTIDGDDRIDVRHVLVREAIMARLIADHRRGLHAALAAACEREPKMGGRSELERASFLARQHSLAGDALRALPSLLVVAAGAERARAFAEADRAYTHALDAWPDMTRLRGPAGVDHRVVLERASEAARLSGEPVRAVALLERALAEPDDAGSPTDSERAARLRMRLGRALTEAGRQTQALEAYRGALEEAPSGSPLRVRILLGLGRTLLLAARHADAIERCEEAVAVARQLGLRRDEADAWILKGAALAMTGRVTEALVAAAEARRSGPVDQAPSPSSMRPSRFPDSLSRYLERATVLERAGDRDGAAQLALEGAAAARAMGLERPWGHALAATAARDLYRLGQWDEADRLTASAPSVSGETVAESHLVRARLDAARGDWESATAHLAGAEASSDAAARGAGWAGAAGLVAAELACWRGHLGEARAAIRRGSDAAADAQDRLTLLELAAVGLRVEAEAARLARARRATQEVTASSEVAAGLWAQLHGNAGPAGRSDPVPGEPDAVPGAQDPVVAALLATGTAEMERLSGRADAAAWQRAVEAWDAAGDPYAAAQARWRLGEAQLEHGAARSIAVPHIRAALEVAERLGAEPLVREIEELARRARLSVRQEPTAPAASPGESPSWAEARRLGLSEREIEVLALLAEGSTDREIGARLFVTEKTAGHHVSHILTKLMVARRGEAAAIAHRLGLAAGA